MACFTTASCVHFLLVASLYIAAADVTCTSNSQPGCAGDVRSDQLLQRSILEDKVDIHDHMKEKEEQEEEEELDKDPLADGMMYCELRRVGNPHSPDWDGTCPVGMEPIPDEAECNRAASVLAAGNSENFDIMGESKTIEHRMDVPQGCYLDKKKRTTMKVKFNTLPGKLNPEMINKHRSICGGKFYVGGRTPEACGARTITNAEDCEKAADAYGYEYGGDGSMRTRPDGCIFRLVKNSANPKAHLHKIVTWNQGKNHAYPKTMEERLKMDKWRPVAVLCQALGTPSPLDSEKDLYCETTGKQECSQCDGELEGESDE